MQVDVLVVGGGPAGAAAASWLAQAGFEVVLLDRACFPRDKACGEFLTPQTRPLLQQLGAWEAVHQAGLRPVEMMVLCAANGTQTQYAPADGQPVGYALRRFALDAALLENARRAGVEVREGTAVRKLMRDSHGKVIGATGLDSGGEPFSLHACLVIGADGSHSLVGRQLGLVRPLPRLQRIAIVTHWRGVSGHGNTIEMRARGPIVCGLDFPGGSTTGFGCSANLTLVIPTDLSSRIVGRAGAFVEEVLETMFPDLAERLSCAECEDDIRTIGCFGHACRPPVADGALLVGDAAAFIDPFTGEGIYFGLQGAQLAAVTATEALRAGDTSRQRLLAYAYARRELEQRYRLCDLVQRVVRNPGLLNHVVARLSKTPLLADRLLRVLGDLRPPSDVLHPAFLWRLLAPEL